jgi:hypothetical protein
MDLVLNIDDGLLLLELLLNLLSEGLLLEVEFPLVRLCSFLIFLINPRTLIALDGSDLALHHVLQIHLLLEQ